MITAIKNIFFPPKKALFKHGDRIQVRSMVTARNAKTEAPARVQSDMILIFQEETPISLMFKVRNNYYPTSILEARDGEIVYFTKKQFRTIQYKINRY